MNSIYRCPYFICVMTSASPVKQVRQLLVDDPGNSEYVDMERELKRGSSCIMVVFFWFFFFKSL
jgi:hypothetical protein